MVSSLDGMQSAKMVWWCWKAGGQYVRRIVVVPCGARGLQAEGRLFEGAVSHVSISVVDRQQSHRSVGTSPPWHQVPVMVALMDYLGFCEEKSLQCRT